MQGLDILRHFISLKREQWLDRDSLERVQKMKLERVVNAASSAPYYRKLMDQSGIRPSEIAEDPSALPLTTKEDLRRNNVDFMAAGFRKENLQRFRTSGSTGMPLEIYADREAANYRLALVYLYEIVMGRSPFDVFAEVSTEYYIPNRMLTATGLFRKIWLPVLDPEEKNLSIVCGSGASMLKSYPSVLTIMSRLNGMRSKPARFKSIISHAEMLSKETKVLAEDSFSCPVYNHYGALEVRSIAWTCPEEGSLHVNGSSVIVEVVDKSGKIKKSGCGEIVITALHNRAMPFLRYRMGDFGSWGKECACGRGYPVLKSMEGRASEFITLPSGKMKPASAMGLLSVESSFYSVWQYQIIQEKSDLFVIKYVPINGDLSRETKRQAEKAIKGACGGEEVRVEFERVDKIPRGRTGKINRVISKVRPDDVSS